jgi:hypothetical protein
VNSNTEAINGSADGARFNLRLPQLNCTSTAHIVHLLLAALAHLPQETALDEE